MRAITLLLAGATWWMTPTLLAAQPATPGPLTRLDLHVSLGWAHVERPDLSSYDDWDHAIAHASFGVGWYWTDHLKTEIDIGAHTRAEFYRFERFEAGGQTGYRSSRFRVGSQGIGVAQLYQFGRNTWVHPYLGAGVGLRRDVIDEDVDPVVLYDSASRQLVQIEAPRHVGPRASYDVRPFVLAGVKAYFSERAHVRTDMRASGGRALNEVVARVGIGVDF